MDGAAEFQVAAQRDREAFELFLLPAQDKQIAESLGRMLATAVSGVEDRARCILCRDPRSTVMWMAQYDEVGVGAYDAYRIGQTLPFGRGTRAHIGGADDRTTEPVHGRFEAQAGSGRGLVEQRRHDQTVGDRQVRA